ncbi:ABC transporter permease [Nitriliruptor alkaliphilus]|uniref:ABC transporter permease n=1 Tax=Nitriliruptor alkaliphilus TaxID=427918 RepID=UPI000AAE0E62|nr:ABC transporter permease [Nitriliruptor alkaliphilus]
MTVADLGTETSDGVEATTAGTDATGAMSPSPPVPSRAAAVLRAGGAAGRSLAVALPVPLLLLVFWHVGVVNAWRLPFDIKMAFVPTPIEVVDRLRDLLLGGVFDDAFSGTAWQHLWASTQRVLTGFVLAVLIAVPLGIWMGRSRLVFRLLDPTINLIRPVPVTAWAPLSLLIIGFGDRSTIFLVFLAAFFPVLLNTIGGVQQVSPRLIEAAAMLGTRPRAVLYRVVLPASMRSIVSGLRIALGLSWVILVVGETVGIRVGLGSMITQARDMSKTDLIVAGMVIIGLAGFLADRLLNVLIRFGTQKRPTLS